jgi:hypothetical protein
MTQAEKAMAEKTGVTPEQRKADITDAFHKSDSADAFRAALNEKGYVLARGEKRSFVVVDGFGKVHSLARQVQGAKTKQVNAKLASISPDQLPSVDQAKEAVLRRGADAKARVDVRVNRRMAELSGKLKIQQAGRRLKLDGRKQEIDTEHASERMALHAAHKSEAQKPFTRAAGAILLCSTVCPGCGR